MRWRRRTAAIEVRSTSVELAPRLERALVVLATQTQQLDGRLEQLDGRLEHLERRLGEVEDGQVDAPSQNDLLDVRVHSARVAAELARVTVELRAEIEEVAHAAAHRAASPRDRRIATLAEQIIDLSDGWDTRPADLQHHSPSDGWAATA